MLTKDLFRQTNAYATQLGGLFGLYWCVGLLCMVAGFKVPLFQAAYPIVVMSAPFVGFALASHFGKQVRNDAPVDFSRGYLFSILMYLYATIILASIAFIYFHLFDHGSFINANIEQLNRPETRTLLESPGIKEQINQMLLQTGFSSLAEMMKSFTPIMIAANILDINLMLSIILAIPTALFAKTKNGKHIQQQ